MRVHTGTSGFSYKEWKGSFYPPTITAAAMLPFYASRFSTVEINNTFHRMPSAKLLEGWAAQVPDGFTFALKAAQRITHKAKLGEAAADPVAYFLRVARGLEHRLGPILFQLPPYLKKDAGLLKGFLDLLPRDVRVAFEFRSSSWSDGEIEGLLRGQGAALCVSDTDDREPPPLVPTASWGYLRLRRREYDDRGLAEWTARIAATGWSEVFVYFKHEDEARGPLFASVFQDVARRTGLAA